MDKKRQTLLTRLSALICLSLIALSLSSCHTDYAAQDETNQTADNHNAINAAIRVPSMSFSQRRWTLVQFYAQIINRPRLYTCTMFTSRGGMGSGSDILGIEPTIGIAVNLGFQVTDPGQAEPDSVHSPASTDQTLVTFQNGDALVTEADSSSVTGDCNPAIHPNTDFQKQLDYILEEQPKPPTGDIKQTDTKTVNFLCTGNGAKCDNANQNVNEGKPNS